MNIKKTKSENELYCSICGRIRYKNNPCPEHPQTKWVDLETYKKINTAVEENKKADEVFDVLEDPKLFERITIQELDKKIVGEISTRQTAFLTACGIFVENAAPTSFNSFGNSIPGAGKDWVITNTLAIFPKEICIKRTRISKNVLTYWHDSRKEPEWSWDGKLLYLEDTSSEVLNSDVLKVFLSGGTHSQILVNQTVVELRINGKPVIFITAAQAAPKAQQIRRLAHLSCDEGVDQSRAIITRQAELAASGKNLEYDELVSRALGALKRVNVVIPFAPQIAKEIATTNVIVRTVFPRFLDLIKASAALHQFQREHDSDGNVIATLQDYEIARIAIYKTINNSSLIPLTHEQKKLINIIKNLTATKKGLSEDEPDASVAELEPWVNFWEVRYMRDQLNLLADSGILLTGQRKEEGVKQKIKTYRLAPQNQVILPELTATVAKVASDVSDAKVASDANVPSTDVKPNNCINCTTHQAHQLHKGDA